MWLNRFQEIAKKQSIRAAGLMSGTSADGIDVIIADFTVDPSGYKGHSVVAFGMFPYRMVTSQRIRDAASLKLQEVVELDLAIGREFASALLTLCKDNNIDPSTIDLVGSHGQTVYHHSNIPGAQKASLQLGCGDAIAEVTNLPVIHDFRRKDIVLGGEGAPLTPFADFVFYGNSPERAILNLGGIANLSVLGAKPGEIAGFDTGPANAPLDRLVSIITNGKQSYDKDGKLALSGTSKPALVKTILSADTYLQKSPPKSSGFEMYGDSFVRYLIGLNKGVADVHLLATVVEYTAQTISESIKKYVKNPLKELVLAGGGAKNIALKKAIEKAVSPIKVMLSDDIGVPSDAREALAFALFAVYTATGHPSSLPNVTGASRAACLGKISFPG